MKTFYKYVRRSYKHSILLNLCIYTHIYLHTYVYLNFTFARCAHLTQFLRCHLLQYNDI